jgi:1-acyl-sn-glycerol-3-phosphate acyltransferase
MDPAVDAVFVHRNKRVPRFLGKDTLATTPIFGKIFVGAGSIPVYRGSSSAGDSLRAARQALKDGKIVVIYPEGTITKQPEGWPMHSRTGVARLALANDVLVLPAARWGTKAILDGYNKKFRPFPRHQVTTVVGEPVDLSAYRDKPVTTQVLREVTDLLMKQVTTMVAEVRGETPPAEVFRPTAKAKAGATETSAAPETAAVPEAAPAPEAPVAPVAPVAAEAPVAPEAPAPAAAEPASAPAEPDARD